MFHDSRYGEECPHGHGWYLFDDGCAVTGCENAPGVEGGVPEQGLREALEFLEAKLRILLSSHLCVEHGSGECGDVDGAREAIRRTRAALERPRPALPAPEPRSQSCGHSMLAEGIEVGCVECAIELGRRMGHVDAGYVLSHEEVMRRAGAALPAEHAPPAFTDEDFKAMAGAAMLRDTDETGTSPPPRPWQRLKKVYMRLRGVSSLRAPQSGPWIAKQSGRDWIVVAPSLQDTPGTSCWQADDFAPREQAEAVRDALNRVAGSGAETP